MRQGLAQAVADTMIPGTPRGANVKRFDRFMDQKKPSFMNGRAWPWLQQHYEAWYLFAPHESGLTGLSAGRSELWHELTRRPHKLRKSVADLTRKLRRQIRALP